MKSLLIFLFSLTMILLLRWKPQIQQFQFDEQIKIFVKGEVLEPKEYSIAKHQQIKDLLPLLNLTKDADIQQLNPYQYLHHEDVLTIPIKQPENNDSKVNINYADIEKLLQIDGIGKVTAERIVAYRLENGLFQRIEDVLKVKGIGEKKFQQIKDFIEI